MLPSLLYIEKPDTEPIPANVFEDLKLTGFFSVTEGLFPCTGENASAREEALGLLLNDTGLFSAFSKLNDYVYKLSVLNGRMKKDKNCLYRSALLFSAIKTVIAFADTASTVKCGRIFSRFGEYFSDFLRGLDAGIRAEIEKTEKTVSDVFSATVTIGGKTATMKKETGKAYITRLYECAEKLGIENIDSARGTENEVLSTAIYESFCKLSPDGAKEIVSFADKYESVYDENILSYENEIHFYLEAVKTVRRINNAGIPTVFPTRPEKLFIRATDAYDISLLEKNETNIVPNDIDMNETDPFYYLSGANGGGKTTYLRAVGITALFSMLGLPVPAKSAEIGYLRSVYTHFPHDERFDGTGRFVEEKTRADQILSKAEKGSVVLLNETYSSTNEENAVKNTVMLADTLFGKGIFGLYITHQHAIGETKIPYLNVLVDKNDENRRTYKVERRRGTEGSFAFDILKKYRLTEDDLKERFFREDDKI